MLCYLNFCLVFERRSTFRWKTTVRVPYYHSFWSVQAFMQCYLNPPQMTSRSATWRLFKQFKRFLPCFHVVIDICMKTNPTLDNWKIVARVLSFKMVWIGAHSHPLKHPNAQKTAPAQDTQQRLRHIWRKGSLDTKDNMTAKQMSSSTISTSFIYQNT